MFLASRPPELAFEPTYAKDEVVAMYSKMRLRPGSTLNTSSPLLCRGVTLCAGAHCV